MKVDRARSISIQIRPHLQPTINCPTIRATAAVHERKVPALSSSPCPAQAPITRVPHSTAQSPGRHTAGRWYGGMQPIAPAPDHDGSSPDGGRAIGCRLAHSRCGLERENGEPTLLGCRCSTQCSTHVHVLYSTAHAQLNEGDGSRASCPLQLLNALGPLNPLRSTCPSCSCHVGPDNSPSLVLLLIDNEAPILERSGAACLPLCGILVPNSTVALGEVSTDIYPKPFNGAVGCCRSAAGETIKVRLPYSMCCTVRV